MNTREIYKTTQLYQSFSRDIENGRVHHAYLLESADSIMLHDVAQYMAEALVSYQNQDKDLAVSKVQHKTHPDVLYYGQELKGKMLTIDEIGKIVSDVMLAPMESAYKIMIVDHFDLANLIAQNKFLKTLEEPPQNIVFLLLCHNTNNLLTTIKSRCQKERLPLCEKQHVKEYLVSLYGEKQGLEEVVAGCQGNLSVAVQLYGDSDYQAIRRICLDIVTKMVSSGEVLEYSSQLLQYKDRLAECFTILGQCLSDIAKYQQGMSQYMLYLAPQEIKMQVRYSPEAITEIVKRIESSKKMLKSNCQAQGVVDSLLLGILEVRYQCK